MNLKKPYLIPGVIRSFSIFGPDGKREGLLEQHLGFAYLAFSTLPGVPDGNFLFAPSEHDTVKDNKSTRINTDAIFLKKDEFNIYNNLKRLSHTSEAQITHS